MAYRWNIYCITEGCMKTHWSDTAITECPSDSTHQINPDSVSFDKIARLQFNGFAIVSTTNNVYTSLYSFITQGSNFISKSGGPPLYFKLVAQVDQSTPSSYDFRLITLPDQLVLYESLGNINTDPTIISIPTSSLQNVPSTETVIYLQFRTSGAAVTVSFAGFYNSQSI